MILLPSDPIEVVIARTSGPPRPPGTEHAGSGGPAPFTTIATLAWIPMQGKLVNKST